MDGKVVLIVIAVIAVMTLGASIYRNIWFTLISGGLLVLGISVVAILLSGLFVGSSMKRVASR